MQYETEVTIDLPRARVIELFDSTENMYKWQTGLTGLEHLAGEPGQPGAKIKLIYDEGGRKAEMLETIVERDLPDTLTATYEIENVYNLVRNRFFDEGPDKTRWRMEVEFRFKGWMAVLALLMRSAFPKQTLKDMNAFKAFAEAA
jgi:hypothetical protein